MEYEEFKEEMEEPEKEFIEYYCNDCECFFNNEDFELDGFYFCPYCGSLETEELTE